MCCDLSLALFCPFEEKWAMLLTFSKLLFWFWLVLPWHKFFTKLWTDFLAIVLFIRPMIALDFALCGSCLIIWKLGIVGVMFWLIGTPLMELLCNLLWFRMNFQLIPFNSWYHTVVVWTFRGTTVMIPLPMFVIGRIFSAVWSRVFPVSYFELIFIKISLNLPFVVLF